jgi:hypothetical protein
MRVGEWEDRMLAWEASPTSTFRPWKGQACQACFLVFNSSKHILHWPIGSLELLVYVAS